MKTGIKKLITALAIGGCMISLGGCMKTVEEMKMTGDNAIEFVSDKYGKEFTPLTYELADYLSENDLVHCYTEGMDPENEHVEILLTKNGDDYIFQDNYFGYYIRPEAENYISSMIAPEFNDFKVYRDNEYEMLSDELTCSSTLEDLFRVHPEYLMKVKVYINGDPNTSDAEYREKMHRIEQALLATNHNYRIRIFVVSPEVYYTLDRYEREDFNAFYASHREPDGEMYYYLYQSTIRNGEVM